MKLKILMTLIFFIFDRRYLLLRDGGSGLGLNDGPDVKCSSIGWCLMLVCGWTHRGSAWDFAKLLKQRLNTESNLQTNTLQTHFF